MKTIKIKAPAKINYTLEVLNKRHDGFHNIQSIMQTINLYDFLTFHLSKGADLNIELTGNSKEIPYDKNNLVYKAAVKFFETLKIKEYKLKIFIEKNIPVASGLAGGSTDAAAALFALNKLFDNPLNIDDINKLCASLGSDLNFCLKGGCALCTSRGEIIEPLPVFYQRISLIKPKYLGISAKEAYTKFSQLNDKTIPNNTIKLKNILLEGKFDENLLYNSLENVLLPYYPEFSEIKNNIKNSIMTGSGSTFFVLKDKVEYDFNRDKYEIIENLETIQNGVIEI